MKRLCLLSLLIFACGCISGNNQDATNQQDNPSNANDCESRSTIELADQCHLKASINGANMSQCDRISSPTLRGECYMRLTLSTSGDSCQQITDKKGKDDCFSNSALSERNHTLCQRIEDIQERQICRNKINNILAFLSSNTTKPDKISTGDETHEGNAPPETPTGTGANEDQIQERPTTTTTLEQSQDTTTSTMPQTGIQPNAPINHEKTQQLTNYSVNISFLNVGYGESTLIQTPNLTILVNCGGSPTVIKNKLAEHKVKVIDYLIVTQPTEEDYGGCIELLKENIIKNVLDGGQQPYTSKSLYVRYMGYSQMQKHELISQGYTITDGEAEIKVLNPKETSPAGDPMENSIVLRLGYGSTNVLLMGDCDSPCDSKIQANETSNILKIPNHGTKRTSTAAFIKKTDPEMVIIGESAELKENPSFETMNALKAVKSKVFYTREGDINILLLQGGYRIIT